MDVIPLHVNTLKGQHYEYLAQKNKRIHNYSDVIDRLESPPCSQNIDGLPPKAIGHEFCRRVSTRLAIGTHSTRKISRSLKGDEDEG